MKKSICFAGCTQGMAPLLAGAAITFLCFAAAAPVARGDAAAGRAAYEKGDYARAMSEWQSAADHGDPEAQFGLGSLYELGAGDLKQDYGRANYWYQKAASKDYIEAEYRLALIWVAGGDGFPADLAEAYKWVLLAAESKGVWGSLAADLKLQLDKVVSSGQQAEAKKRAAAWKDARDPGKEEKPVAAAAPVAQPISPLGKPTTGGCPGWPFPTLPCTEEFPPLPGPRVPSPPSIQSISPSPPALAPKAPLDALNDALTQIECASVRGQTSVQGVAILSGTVPNALEKEKLIQLAGRFFPNSRAEIKVDIIPPPLCESLADFNAMSVAGLITESGLGVRLNNGVAQLHEGDPIKIEVRSPAYPIDLRLDYFSIGGEVLHLWPTGDEPTPRLAAGVSHLFGDPANGKVIKAGGPPFGREMIAVVATPSPIELGPRPAVEKASEYLRDLKRALGRMSVVPDRPNLAATLLVNTGP